MLGMSEGSALEREKEILKSNDDRLIEKELTLGSQIGTAFDAYRSTAPNAEQALMVNEITDQVKRLEELTGEDYTFLGWGTDNAPTGDRLVRDYSALTERVKELKSQGHDIKDIDDIMESVNSFRKESIEKQEMISALANDDNKYKALLANVLGAVGGYLTTPEGVMLTAAPGIAGGAAALATKTPLRAVGSVAAIEGAAGAYISGEEVVDRAEIMGEEVEDDEVRYARVQGGALTALLVGGIGAAPQVGKVAISGFSKVNGYISDSAARTDLLNKIKGIDKAMDEKGAIPPEVKARRDELADIHDIYATKPETVTAEEHVTRLDAQLEELKAEELIMPEAPEELEVIYKKNLPNFEPEDLQAIAEADDILNNNPNFSEKLFEDLDGGLNPTDEFNQGRGALSQLEQVITCMTRSTQ